MRILATVILTVVVGALAGWAFIYSGAFNTAADQPHSGIVLFLAQTARERSIAARSNDISVPNLADPKVIAAGATEYAEMYTGCHLAPGMEDNEMRPGLYPYPPNLAAHRHDAKEDPQLARASAARQFWIIKHGIKMTGMPAWVVSYPDADLWKIVAFFQTMPGMTQETYKSLVETGKQ